MKMEIRTITPELAFSWLQKNRDNRKVRLGWVRDLTGMIQRGEFQLTHQGIAFSETGRLLDGQHRLLAIVDAGIPVQMVVTHNVPSDTFASLDKGANRSFSDMYGVDSIAAGVSRFISSIIFDRSFSPVQQNSIHLITGPAIKELRLFCNANKRGISVAPVHTAAVLRMLADEDQEYIKLVYWNLVHTKHSELPPIGRLFIDQIYGKLTSVTGSSNGGDIFARALKVFDKNAANSKILRVTDTSSSYEFVRSVILPRLQQEKRPGKKKPRP